MLCHVCYAEPDAAPDCEACRGTGRATSIPLCVEPWNEVVPGLFQGGHDVRSQSRTACVVDDEFDLVVSMTTREGYGPAEGVEHHVARMADAGVDAGIAARVDELAESSPARSVTAAGCWCAARAGSTAPAWSSPRRWCGSGTHPTTRSRSYAALAGRGR